MSGNDLAQLSTLIIFAANALLLTGLISLKAVHRTRVHNHDGRRAGYITLISRHIAYENCTDPITPKMAEDPAFLDALIDVRNALDGDDNETLGAIVGRYGITARQATKMRSRFSLGRRLRAAVALAEIGDDSAASVLLEHLSDTEPEIRIQAARGLGRMSWTPGIDAIVERFAIETPWVRTRFADTLIGFGPDATWPLLAYVRVNQAFETAGPVAAIRTLATIGDVQAVEPLIETLRETSNIEVQVAIIDSLGLLGSPVALPSIYEAAAAENWLLRSSAVSALGGIGDIESIPTLALSLTDLNWWVRRNAAASLAQIPGGIDELYEALSGADRYGADAAAEALIDAGELVAARRHLEEGQADRHDLALLGHMNGAEKVSR